MGARSHFPVIAAGEEMASLVNQTKIRHRHSMIRLQWLQYDRNDFWYNRPIAVWSTSKNLYWPFTTRWTLHIAFVCEWNRYDYSQGLLGCVYRSPNDIDQTNCWYRLSINHGSVTHSVCMRTQQTGSACWLEFSIAMCRLMSRGHSENIVLVTAKRNHQLLTK